MTPIPHIHADATFRELAQQFPATKPLLEKCPTAKVGKQWSLQQVNVLPGEFVNDLAKAAKAEIWPAALARPPRILGHALLLLVLGLLALALWQTGLHLTFLFMPNTTEEPLAFGATIPYWWYSLQSVQMWGWLFVGAFALAGAVLRAGITGSPASPLALAGRIMLATGLLVMLSTAIIGGPGAPLERGWAAAYSQACVLLAAALFMVDLLMLLRGRSMDIALLLLLLAGQWMLVWLAASVSIQWRFRNDPMGDAPLVRLLSLLPSVAFAVHLVMAISARTLPGLLGLRPLRQRALLLGLAFFNAGIIALLPWPSLGPAAATALAALRVILFALAIPTALFLFLAGLNFLLPRPRQPAAPGGLMLRLAFIWLALGLLLAAAEFLWQYSPQLTVPPSYVALYRLFLTAGFMGSFVFGLAVRLMPLFLPPGLRSNTPATLASALWTAGILLYAIAYCSVLLGEPHVLWVLQTASIMQLAAAVILAMLILRTRSAARRVRTKEFTAATPLDAALNASPKLELALAAAHIGLLENATRPPAVALGPIAIAWGWDLPEFLDMLTQAAK